MNFGALGQFALGQAFVPVPTVWRYYTIPAGHFGFAALGELALGQGEQHLPLFDGGNAPEAPRGTRSKEIPFLSLVLAADPDYYAEKRHQPEFEFSGGRTFYHDPSRRGAYADD